MNLKIISITTICLFLLLQGCIPSLHPLYTKDKIVYLELLEGVWADQQEDTELQSLTGKEKDDVATIKNNGSALADIWDFRKNDDNGYLLIHQDNKGRKAAFDIYVVKLGDDYFMDFYMRDLPKNEAGAFSDVLNNNENDLAVYHTILVHTFAKLIVVKDEVKIKMFDPDFLEKLFKQRQIRIKHEQLDDGQIVLTAQPEELQKFVEKYADHNEAYIDDVIVLSKQI